MTLVAALVPALRATRVAPVAAMSRAPARRRRGGRAAHLRSLEACFCGRRGSRRQGLFGSGPASARLGAIAGGAVAIFLGVAFLARYLVRPLAGVIGWPIERALPNARAARP